MRSGDSNVRDRTGDQNELNQADVHECGNHNFNMDGAKASSEITNITEANLSTLAKIVKTHYAH